MESLYLLLLNFGDIFHLVLYMIPAIIETLFSMWQTYAFIGLVLLLLVAQSTMQYYFVDKHEKMFEDEEN